MKKLLILVFASLIPGLIFSQGGVKGKVTDEKGNGIPYVNIALVGTSKGAVTENDGSFEITNVEKGTYVLSISSIGFSSTSKNITIEGEIVDLGSIELAESDKLIDEVVISGSRKLEKLTESPVTIDIIRSKDLDQFAGSADELFAQLKGVDFGRIGAFLGGFNVRGFNSAFNPKMLQLDDNRYSTLIATGLAYGPMSPIIKEDIQRVELVLGPSSALYGPNALNGLINTISKSPFTYEGTDIVIGGGSNALLSGRIRHAKRIGEKFAYKITGEYTKGTEIDWTDSVYLGTTGVTEVDLDRNVSFLKGTAGIYYRPTDNSEIGLVYGGSKSNYISVTNAGRNQIKDWELHFAQVTFKSSRWFAQLYNTWSYTGNTFNINTRTKNYYALLTGGATEEEALANSMAGPSPAVFKDKSKRFNAELQYNNNWDKIDVALGAQLQSDLADSKHTYLLDQDGAIGILQTGVYGQLKYKLGKSVNFILAARGDNHDLFGFSFLPKAGVTYTQINGTFRITYGKGFATPTILNTNMNLFGGLVLGNGEGFTLSDGSKIDPLSPETIQTFEIGYKGHFADKKLYLDVNAYYNMSENFISPLMNIVPTGLTGGPVVTQRGDVPIADFNSPYGGGYILTYLNFGHVDNYGLDLGINYYFSKNYSVSINYSYFDFNLDENDMDNDGNGDGVVTVIDLPLNTPKNKLSASFNVSFDKVYGSILTRWIQKYNFYSGRNVASETNTDIMVAGFPVVENQLVGTQWNYGQLGGFYLSLNAGYKVNDHFAIGIYANNLVGTGNYEFVASPPAQVLWGAELKVKF